MSSPFHGAIDMSRKHGDTQTQKPIWESSLLAPNNSSNNVIDFYVFSPEIPVSFRFKDNFVFIDKSI